MMLLLDRVIKDFGGIRALNDVSLNVQKGDFLGLIGPNGSGKTTCFNVIAGHLKSDSGRIFFRDKNISSLSCQEICHLGIARTFQVPRPFKTVSVVENVMAAVLFGRRDRTLSEEIAEREVRECLDFVGLEVDRFTMPAELTAGNLRKLELARALATKPELLLVDECMSGLNPEEIARASLVLKKIQSEMGITIIWVEHVLSAIMSLVRRVVVLDSGRIIAEGAPREVSKNPKVIEAYLGKKETEESRKRC